ncbi:MAG: sporulation protein YqfD, partial [Clostridia bacterium]|nr:sporulation protein YqfD [Clostridia bacterium]
MMEKMLRFVRGTVRVDINGAAIERFIDLCRLYGVRLWDITWVEEGLVSAQMFRCDRDYAEELAAKAMCGIEFGDFAGLRVVLRPLRGRWALFFMAVMCTAVCFGSTLFLWKIRIEGCASISALELLGQLESMGLRRGCLLSSVDVHRLQREVMNLRDDIERITINLKGTEAFVTVAEKDLSR